MDKKYVKKITSEVFSIQPLYWMFSTIA